MNFNEIMLEAMRGEMFQRMMAAENEAAGKEVANNEETFIKNLEHLATVDEDDSTKTRFLPVNTKWNIYRLIYPESAYKVDIEISKIDGKDFCIAKVRLFRSAENLKDDVHSGFGMKTLALENVPVFADMSERVELWRSMAFKSALSKALDSEGVAPWIPSREDKDQTQPLPPANMAAIDKKVKAAMEKTQQEVKEGAKQENAKSSQPNNSSTNPKEKKAEKPKEEKLPISDNLPSLQDARAKHIKLGGKDVTLGELENDFPEKLVGKVFKFERTSQDVKNAVRVIVKNDLGRFRDIIKKCGLTEKDF